MKTLIAAVTLVILFSGCALYSDEQNLEKRVAKLEAANAEREAAKVQNAAENEQRRGMLEFCVTTEADAAFWDYVKLNGTEKDKAKGIWTAPVRVWDEARKVKQDKIEQCKMLYGPKN